MPCLAVLPARRARAHLRAGLFAAAMAATLASARAQLPTSIQVAPSPADPLVQAPARAPVTGADPVVGSVDGKLIYLSDVTRVVNTLPEQMRNLPFESVMPVLLDRIIDHEALTLQARRSGLDRNPDVQRDMRAAADLALERAWLARATEPIVTEAAIQARYNRVYANRPPTDEVRARHILVGTEDEAKDVLKELKRGTDFASLARAISKDPDNRQGGDLGFFRRDQVWPAFADLAFSLQPGQVGPYPVHNEFGWHVVKVEERRLVAPPTLSEVHDQIRQELTKQAVRTVIGTARGQMIIHKFNLDGSEVDPNPRLSSESDERNQ